MWAAIHRSISSCVRPFRKSTDSKMIITVIGTLVATAFLYRYKRNIYLIAKTFRRDLRGAKTFVKLNITLWLWSKQNKTVAKVFSYVVEKYPDKIAFCFEDEVWTYKQAAVFVNKIAQYFKSQGYKKGDCIALLLENRPEYPLVWLGLSKIGVITSLINTNLTNEPLMHSIKICKAKALIFGSEKSEAVKGIVNNLPDVKLFQFHENSNSKADLLCSSCINLRECLVNASSDELNCESSAKDPLIYIYTSGTTGLPKAAIVTNLRYIFMAMGIKYAAHITTDDVLYGPLPLYHSAGGILGCGQVLLNGVTFAIRKKFSASNYFKDCVKYKCTLAQYVGEICRYVLAASENNPPVKHSVRALYGNGLRGQIWKEFVDKFNIKDIYEFYGSTEGVSSLVNLDNTVGSIGFIPIYLRIIYPISLIKYNEVTEEPVRNKDGLCIKCNANEPGLIIAPINPKKELLNFKGYCDEEATKKKILHNVYKHGDKYFNSGDVLIGDEFGYFYFKDRLGDTFRWKGENVSTSEIEAVISNIINLNDAVVYGVLVPGTEGRAGMAAIVDEGEQLNLNELGTRMKNCLASYAIPVFIRVLKSMPKTGTYKLIKTELQLEGFDMDKVKDSMYVYNSKLGKYLPLTREFYEQIKSGKINI